MNRAKCYFDLKMHIDAITDLEAALTLNHEDPQVLYRLGIVEYYS